MRAWDHTDADILRLLTEYSYKNNILLKINEKGLNGMFLLLCGCKNNNNAIINLLKEYANENFITLNINEKNNNGIIHFSYLVV